MPGAFYKDHDASAVSSSFSNKQNMSLGSGGGDSMTKDTKERLKRDKEKKREMSI
jgi:hypothetical protein